MSVVLLAVTLAACSSKPAQEKPLAAVVTPLQGASPVQGASPPESHPWTGPKADIGEFGLDLTAGKPQVKPGDDFNIYASGNWFDHFEIPADRSSFGAFNELDELSKKRVRQIIEAAAATQSAAGTPAQRIGDYYAAYLDQGAIEANGMTPVQDDLKRISAAHSKKDIATLFGLAGFASLFDVDLPPDLLNPDQYSVVISQSRLGLPDRDYYLKDDPKLADIREKYTAYIERMLQLGGIPEAHAKARDIMAFETEVARRQWPIEKRRDVKATYNPQTKTQLVGYAPWFPWQSFFDALEIGARRNFILSEIDAIKELAQLYDQTSLPTLKAYLTFHYLSDHAPYLPQRFDDARFDFYGRTLRGQPQQRERWKRAVDEVNDSLGEQVGQLYVEKYFPAESKTKMQQLVGNLRASLSERIDQLDWMTPETKKRAHDKLATFTPKIGYPDHWKDYSGLEVKRNDLVGNVRRAALWHWRYQVARLDKPVDRSEWQMTPQEINAYYNPLNNEIVFPAAILQPPFFDPKADAAVNYGGIGAVIGHEIGHGFDDQGRMFGPDGSMKEDWWTPRDADEFTKRVQRLIAQFSAYEALPGLHVNGASTVGENIGDLGGLNMAYHAYRLSLQGQAAPVIDGLSGDQRFFLSWAQVWRTKYRDGALREIVMSDVHSPAQFRVNGPLPNIDAWYEAFNVQPTDKLYIKPADRVSIW
jgi:predicted metalloendopeptidase